MSHYTVLGIQPNASREEIQVAYRRLAMRYHPDRPDADAARFLQIQAARDSLIARLDKVGLFDDIFDDVAKELRGS